ncbi:MAG: heavy metal translocating P-type ATPase metal-binding domain-containing protein [Bacteroidetes bacterium]|nr:heavy metal translocating P-type ATPase metal-binding domain-containing protein [Bacteroidota bacterium]
MIETNTKIRHKCFHCGDDCIDESISKEGKFFCCQGCLFVYDLLKQNKLDNFYELTDGKGLQPISYQKNEFEFLDNTDIISKFLTYSINGKSKVVFNVPQIYCSACLWLLEHLSLLDNGIIESRINFLSKDISILFNDKDTSLRKVVELLTTLGYKPNLNLASLDSNPKGNPNKPLYVKVGIAGFAFGNIMLFSLPEYLSIGALDPTLKQFLSYLVLALSFISIYASRDYFSSALLSIKLKHVNLDVPISLGIAAIYARSIYEVLSATGPGYFDSMAGLVFFLLCGKVFQIKTYHSISFERDYKSYFPLSVIKRTDKDEFVPVSSIKRGDLLAIRNNEIVPVDSVLVAEHGSLDYSFITGEANPVALQKGDKIYSGARNKGKVLEIVATKEFNKSYLTELWDNHILSDGKTSYTSKISDTAAKYFSIIVLIIAFGTLLWWLPQSYDKAMSAFISILVVACPCALALSIPFTYGTALRFFGRNNFYLKNDKIIEKLSKIDTIVFDKTGTLTDISKSSVKYNGRVLSDNEKTAIKSIVVNSAHPLSIMIGHYFENIEPIEPEIFNEIPGKGIEAIINGLDIKLGNRIWLCDDNLYKDIQLNYLDIPESSVMVFINNKYTGYFTLISGYRKNLSGIMGELKKKYKIAVISGDNENERKILENIIPAVSEMKFRQLPEDKIKYIEDKKKINGEVMMVGDGLNDAGALLVSDVGVAVTGDISGFAPGSDGILLAEKLYQLPNFMKFARSSVRTVYYSFAISIFYHGITFAIAASGSMSPVIAAVLMPISSISIVLFTVGKVSLHALKQLEKTN